MIFSLGNIVGGGLVGVPTTQEMFSFILKPNCLHSKVTTFISSVNINPK